MLFWICPECGRECSPAVRECPACAGETEAGSPSAGSSEHRSSQNDGILALAKVVEAPVWSARPSAQAPAQELHAANGHSVPAATTMIEIESVSEAENGIQAPVRPLAEPEATGLTPAHAESAAPETKSFIDAPTAEMPLVDFVRRSLREESRAPRYNGAESHRMSPVGTPAAPEAARSVRGPALLADAPTMEMPALVETVRHSPSVDIPVVSVEAALEAAPVASEVPAEAASVEALIVPEGEPVVEAASELPKGEVATVEAPIATEAVSHVEVTPVSPGVEVVAVAQQVEAAPDSSSVDAATETPVAAEDTSNVEVTANSSSTEVAAVEGSGVGEVAPPVEAAPQSLSVEVSAAEESIATVAPTLEAAPESTSVEVAAVEAPAAPQSLSVEVAAVEGPVAADAAPTVEGAPESSPVEAASVEPAKPTETSPLDIQQTVLEQVPDAPKSEPEIQTTAAAYAEALEAHAETILDDVQAKLKAEASEIRAVLETLLEKPKAPLLAAPAEVVNPPAPAAFEWIRIPRPTIAPRAPKKRDLAAVLSGPQVSTLAGPALPAELHNLLEQRTTSQKRRRKSIGIPGWALTILLAVALFLGTGTVLQYLNSTRDNRTAAVATPSGHPVEVTGLRIVPGNGRKPQIQYLVVNHSGADLSGMTLQFVVRSLESNAGTALFSVNAEIPSLGPYQSKEVRTDLDTDLHAAVPDWQYLRADVLASGGR